MRQRLLLSIRPMRSELVNLQERVPRLKRRFTVLPEWAQQAVNGLFDPLGATGGGFDPPVPSRLRKLHSEVSGRPAVVHGFPLRFGFPSSLSLSNGGFKFLQDASGEDTGGPKPPPVAPVFRRVRRKSETQLQRGGSRTGLS
jgi:hypothetical protein